MDGRLRAALVAGLRTGLLLVVPAALAAALAEPLVFPSLGPSAYLLATQPESRSAAPQRVLLSHVLGVLAGFLAYQLLAAPTTLTTLPEPGSPALVGLVASGTLAVALTTVGMDAADASHAPACATTLIVALGLLSTPFSGVLIVASVVVLVATQLVLAELSRRREHQLSST